MLFVFLVGDFGSSIWYNLLLFPNFGNLRCQDLVSFYCSNGDDCSGEGSGDLSCSKLSFVWLASISSVSSSELKPSKSISSISAQLNISGIGGIFSGEVNFEAILSLLRSLPATTSPEV